MQSICQNLQQILSGSINSESHQIEQLKKDNSESVLTGCF